MAYEQRDNSGALFKNEDRRPDKNDSNLTGKVMVGGAMYYVSGWFKEGPKGKWISLSFKLVEEKKPVSNSQNGFEGFEDDIPDL